VIFLKNNNSVNNRNELKMRFSKVFNDKIAGFSTELQRILIDDMITAFEIRLNVLKKAKL
jgi:hypothetical protein